MAMIGDRLDSLRENIVQICQKVGSDPSGVTLVGVTKFATADDIREAVGAGLTDIGENKVQVAQEKFSRLGDLPRVTRHLIGHLQTNKVKLALDIFDMVQSVDSWHLAGVIQKQAALAGKTVDVLVQVNCSGEEQKFGVPRAEAVDLVGKILGLPNIRVRGLMTIAPDVEEEAVVRRCFQDLRQVRDRLSRELGGPGRLAMTYLSMGMTQDYRIALEEGANMLRIGTAIFGPG